MNDKILRNSCYGKSGQVRTYPAYYGVKPDFLNKGAFTIQARNNALKWCRENCMDKFLSSDLYPWAFLSEGDAKKFSIEFGGEVKYKLEELK